MLNRKWMSITAVVICLTCISFSQTSTPVLNAEVSVDTGNGYGSTGVYVRSFTNIDANLGTAITYASDTVNGDTFTINTDITRKP